MIQSFSSRFRDLGRTRHKTDQEDFNSLGSIVFDDNN